MSSTIILINSCFGRDRYSGDKRLEGTSFNPGIASGLTSNDLEKVLLFKLVGEGSVNVDVLIEIPREVSRESGNKGFTNAGCGGHRLLGAKCESLVTLGAYSGGTLG